jgi:apolipoprotein N-acyltransferase
VRFGLPAVLARAAMSAAGGGLLYASFPPRTLWWLAPVGFALLGAAVRGRAARAGFGYGLLFGLGYLLPLLVWTGAFVGPAPWLLLATFEALFCAAAGAGMAAVSTLPGAPVLGAAVWVAAEAARSRLPFGGFPWGKIGFGQPDGPMLPLAALGGSSLLSFAVVMSGLGLAEFARRVAAGRTVGTAGTERPAGTETQTGTERAGKMLHGVDATLIAPALAAVLPLAAGLAATPLLAGADGAGQSDTITVALIQGNVPRAGLDFNAQRRAVLDNHAQHTTQLAANVATSRAPQPDLVVWPENSSDIDPLRNADAAVVIDDAARAVGAPILVGAVLLPYDRTVENAILRWEPGTGSTGKYVKRRTQPFGEYIPLRSVARLVSKDVDRVRRDMVRGDRVGVLDVAGTRVAVATCYEVAFDAVVADAVRAGGTVLVVPTNNATFGYTEMTYQQLAMSRVRAVEHSRTVLVAATSGVSAIVGPDGTVTQQTGLFTADVLVASVPLRTTTTLATRIGATVEWLLVAVGAVSLLLVGWQRRRAAAGQRP